MYKNILVKDIHKVRLIGLNRPKSLNALNKELLKELAEILNEPDKNKKIRCVDITGKEKKSGTVNSSNSKIKLDDNLENGVYSIIIENNEKSFSQKFIYRKSDS